MAEQIERTPRTTVRRLPQRAVYDRAVVNRILDEGFVCHVGFVDNGQPFVIPTGYARAGDVLYLHGSTAGRMARSPGEGLDVCVTVTLIDGLVLARSAFHHSMNYRSVVVLGRVRPLEDAGEKLAALRAFTNHIVAERWDEVRAPTEQELKGTTVLALPLLEASAKIRTGPPIDDEEDLARPVWAGVVPVHVGFGQPVADGPAVEGVAPFDIKRLDRHGH